MDSRYYEEMPSREAGAETQAWWDALRGPDEEQALAVFEALMAMKQDWVLRNPVRKGARDRKGRTGDRTGERPYTPLGFVYNREIPLLARNLWPHSLRELSWDEIVTQIDLIKPATTHYHIFIKMGNSEYSWRDVDPEEKARWHALTNHLKQHMEIRDARRQKAIHHNEFNIFQKVMYLLIKDGLEPGRNDDLWRLMPGVREAWLELKATEPGVSDNILVSRLWRDKIRSKRPGKAKQTQEARGQFVLVKVARGWKGDLRELTLDELRMLR